MKTIPDFRMFFIVLGLITSLGSCSSDSAPRNENSLKLNGESYNVTVASITGTASNGDGHAAIVLGTITGASSKVLTINIKYTGDSDVEGSYSFPVTTATLLIDDILTNYTEFDATTTNTSFTLTKGTTTVVNNGGNNYTVTLNLVLEGGKTFSGTYTGDFVVIFNNGQ